jgi:HlyD family secretion protein
MRKLIAVGTVAAAAAGAIYVYVAKPGIRFDASIAAPRETGSIAPTVAPKALAKSDLENAPAVTVARAARVPLKETVLVTGTLVPRLEVLVAPEVEGLRVVELLVEEGDRVTKGQVLARLERETLAAQLAQSEAALAKAGASIAQAKSNIVAAEARRVEATNAFDRAKPLGKSGTISESTLDQREAAARTAAAQLKVAEDGLRLAEAERLQVEAQKRDIAWKLSKTDVRAPVDGIVSRRSTRLGGLASGASVAQPMFHMILEGRIELEADVPETDLVRLKPGLTAVILPASHKELAGGVRMVSPEVDKATRLGKLRISLPDDPSLRIGSFARGNVVVRSGAGIAVPASALLFGADGAYVQVVAANRVESRKITVGMQAGDYVEIAAGLAEGEVVVARSGTFLRAGDLVRPIETANGNGNGNSGKTN